MPESIETTEFGAKIGPVEFIWARNSKEFLFANSIFIRGKPSLIVDPSASFTYIERLAMTHAADMVLNTHYHADHRSLNSLFKNCIFAAHEHDAPAIRDSKIYEECCDNDPHSFYSDWRKQFLKTYKVDDCPVSQMYKGGETLKTDSCEIELIHLPGHTPGHMALFFKNSGCLYLSDIDLTPYGPWYANVVSHLEDFIASVEKIKNFQTDYYVTSHGERVYTPEQFQEKIERFARHFVERDERILETLKEGPKELAQIASCAIVYKKAALMDPLKAYFQWQMVIKHLELLVKKGIVAKEGGNYLIR